MSDGNTVIIFAELYGNSKWNVKFNVCMSRYTPKDLASPVLLGLYRCGKDSSPFELNSTLVYSTLAST
jgi:hypothetical protein